MPEISVITIFLNPGRFFEEAVASVRAQEFTDWELLLIDDGSTDGSAEQARNFAAEDPDRIRYFAHPNHENRGMSASRNLGLEHVRGKWVAFLDADDVWDTRNLTGHLSILESSKTAVASFTDTYCWYSWTGSTEDGRRDQKRSKGYLPEGVKESGSLIPAWLREKEVTPGMCSVVIQTTIARKYRFENSFRTMFEDQVFLYKVALGERIATSGKTFAYYRQHPDSACQRAMVAGEYHDYRKNAAQMDFLLWLSGYISTMKIRNLRIRACLYRALARYRNPVLWRFLRLGEKLIGV